MTEEGMDHYGMDIIVWGLWMRHTGYDGGKNTVWESRCSNAI